MMSSIFAKKLRAQLFAMFLRSCKSDQVFASKICFVESLFQTFLFVPSRYHQTRKLSMARLNYPKRIP